MKIRLIYHGPLLASQPNSDVKMAPHKHHIRRCIHRQLSVLWATHHRLSGWQQHSRALRNWLVDAGEVSDVDRGAALPEEKLPLWRAVQEAYSRSGNPKSPFEWVPLALKIYKLDCELDILLLRRDPRNSVIQNGDLDNRVKTLIDALKQPTGQQVFGTPSEKEKPFFVLLQDDSQITRLAVESDSLYRRVGSTKSKSNNDERLVHAVITVTLRPSEVTMFNLTFA